MTTAEVSRSIDVAPREWVLEWSARDRNAESARDHVFAGRAGAGSLLVHADPARGLPDLAYDGKWVVGFYGLLLNREDLSVDPSISEAAVVLELLDRGESIPDILRGAFAVVVWDRRTGQLEIARDQLGAQPIYFARSAAGLACSPSVDALLKIEGISRDLDPVALAEYLCHRYEAGDGTFYRDLRRVPPGSRVRLRAGASIVEPYWDPLPADEPVAWIADEEIERFPALFARAVQRCVNAGPASVFLSGGLDSIGVASEAADQARRTGAPMPLALSLGFQTDGADERAVQEQAAAALGLSQVLLPFDEAVEPARLVETALRMGEGWPFPMWNIWAAAYEALARLARSRGCRTILTGRGGDEWLTVSPYHAADLARRGRLVALGQLLRSRNRSYQFAGWSYTRHLLTNRVARPLAGAMLDGVAHDWWQRRRRERLRGRVPGWLAPDASVRAQLDRRLDRFVVQSRPPQGFYVREARAMLRHPAIVGGLEEAHEFGRRHGLAMLHPYWDADLAEFLCRTPPHLLVAGGRSKAPLRKLVTTRLPGLEQRKKADASGFFGGLIARQVPALWQRMGGARTLGALGVVDSEGLDRAVAGVWADNAVRGAGRVWEILALEGWARSRQP